MDKNEELIELPPGYSVREDRAVGYSYFNEHDYIVEQHPYDNNAIRRLVWVKYPQTKELRYLWVLK